MSTASPSEKAVYQTARFLQRQKAKVDMDRFVASTPGLSGLTSEDLKRPDFTLEGKMKEVRADPVLASSNAFVVYDYDKLLAVLGQFRGNAEGMLKDCKNKHNYYKFGDKCHKIDRLIAIELIRYSTEHGMEEGIHHNPDYWINIPVFLEGTNYAHFSMFDEKDRWTPPPEQLAGPPEVVSTYNPKGPTPKEICRKLDMFNEIFPRYGISAIDLYMLAKLGWLLDEQVQRKVVDYVKQDRDVETVVQYVPTLRAIILYNYNFRKPEQCEYRSLDSVLGRRNKPDESATHYTDGVYQFLIKHFNQSSVGRILIPGFKFTADELAAWLARLNVKKLERGFIAKMVNEATLESWQKERFAQMIHLYFDVKPEDREADMARIGRELAVKGATQAYNTLVENILRAGPSEVTTLTDALRRMAGLRPDPKDPNIMTARIHPQNPVLPRSISKKKM